MLPCPQEGGADMIALGLALTCAAFCIFWWAMIEAQTDIPGVNEPGYRRKGEKK